MPIANKGRFLPAKSLDELVETSRMHRGVGGDDRERLQAVSDEDEAGKSPAFFLEACGR